MSSNIFAFVKKIISAKAGVTAVEFALIAPVFLLLLMGLIELSFVFVLSINLQNASASVARQIRVGQIIVPGLSVTTSNGNQLSLTDLKAKICSNMPLVSSQECQSALQVDIRSRSASATSSLQSPFSGQTFDVSNFCYYSGVPGSVVEMRIYYLWSLITPGLLQSMVNVKTVIGGSQSGTGNWVSVSATDIFMNEPNSNSVNTGNKC